MWAAPIVVVALVVLGFVAMGYLQGRWTWDGTGFEGASLWDWVDLLIGPVVLGIGGIWLERAQRRRELESQERQREIERENQDKQLEAARENQNKQVQAARESQEWQRQRELELEEQRRQRELDVEYQRAQDSALQRYLDQMGRLLID